MFNIYPYTNINDLNLDYLLSKIKELEARVNAIEDYGARIAVLEAGLPALENKVESYNNSLRASVTLLNARATSIEDSLDSLSESYLAFYREYAAAIEDIRESVDGFTKKLAEIFPYVNEKSAESLAKSKVYTDGRIKALLDSLPDIEDLIVINPINGELANINDALEAIYSFIRFQGITAGEFDALGFTAGELDAIRFTAEEFDGFAKTFLYRPELHEYVERPYLEEELAKIRAELLTRSPFTGRMDSWNTVLYMVTDLMRWKSHTAGSFDGLELTAGTLDALQESAYNIDWDGFDIYQTAAEMRRMTAGEIDSLEYEAGYLDGIGFTAYEFDTDSRQALTGVA